MISCAIDLSFKAQHYRTDNIMLTMGGDFGYENSIIDYKNIDKLMYYINKVWNCKGSVEWVSLSGMCSTDDVNLCVCMCVCVCVCVCLCLCVCAVHA